jgi:hypothetical protein
VVRDVSSDVFEVEFVKEPLENEVIIQLLEKKLDSGNDVDYNRGIVKMIL